ncbi:NAD(P)/FAD-dependent oxidoreductase [Novosphingobium sp. CECT 9465]|uniref:FAD-dependent oxidoreductase n=1 Tax=Novosphingobium sp. CECT 9465 TaxID=2829794 RepID=UPI001E3880C7|nr:NAD(P)/FAD-dependent oxidoreductase [Novosphingobium sp. CECT 9465]CAH0495257.1 Para-nitrophenol 4-monooxygenase [Novosphingobium sp. CECT 9465]
MKRIDVETLVVGLGPVGAVTALYLARAGISVAGIEAGNREAVDLRASTFHPPTISILDALGVSKTLLSYGLKAPVYQYRDRKSGEVFSFDFSELKDQTPFPFRIQCEQDKVRQEVLDALEAETDAQLSYRSRLLFLDDRGDHVLAWVETGTEVVQYAARYVIGCDGANSVVRKLLDLSFEGFTYPEKYLCLSTDYPLEQAFDGLSNVNYISDPDEWLVLLRTPRLWRVMLPVSEDDDDEALLSDATKEGVFKRILGSDQPVQTRHRTIYRVHQRVCERFSKGRIAIAGDAAHLNSPMGGYGMNSGIHDGINIAEKIVSVLQGGETGDIMAHYDRQRRHVTQTFVQKQSIENMKSMRKGWDQDRADKRERMEILQNDPEARLQFLIGQSMLGSLKEAEAIA